MNIPEQCRASFFGLAIKCRRELFRDATFNGPITNTSGDSSYLDSTFTMPLTNVAGNSDYSGSTFLSTVTNTAGHSNYSHATFAGVVLNTAGNSNYTGAIFSQLLTNTAGDSDFADAKINGPFIVTAGNVQIKDVVFSSESDQAILFTPSVRLQGITKQGLGITTITLTAPNSVEIQGYVKKDTKAGQLIFTKNASAAGAHGDILINTPDLILDQLVFTPSASSLVLQLSSDTMISNSVFSTTAVPVTIHKKGHHLDLLNNTGVVEILE